MHAVRITRQKALMLSNDLKAVRKDMEETIYALHALGPAAFATHIPAAAAPAAGAVGGGVSESKTSEAPAPAPAAVGAGGSSAPSKSPAEPESGELISPTGLSGLSAEEESRLRPFALIDGVSAGSPAATAGMQVGDKILSFGTLRFLPTAAAADGIASLSLSGGGSGKPTLLDIAAETRANQGRPVPLVVLRSFGGAGAAAGGAGAPAGGGLEDEEGLEARLKLTLRPQTWSGQGLLGCHVVQL